MSDTIVSDSLRNSVEIALQQTWINRNPFYSLLENKGRIKQRGGDRLEHKFVIDDSAGYSYGPDSEVEPTQKGEIVTQTFDWGSFARDDKQLGWDLENQGTPDRFSTGTVRQIFETRVENGKSKMFRGINERLVLGVGTPFGGGSGRDFLGLEAFVTSTPTTGTIGELSRTTYSFLQNQTLAGTDGESGIWSNDCWELLLRLRVACQESPMAWGELSKPDVCYCQQSQMTDIIKLAYNQNTNVGARVEDIDSVGGVYVELNSALTSNTVQLLTSGTWTLYKPPGTESFIELDVRSQLENRMNLKDIFIIWKARGCLMCEWLPQNGMISGAHN